MLDRFPLSPPAWCCCLKTAWSVPCRLLQLEQPSKMLDIEHLVLAHTHTCTDAHTGAHTHAHTHACMHARTYALTHSRMHTRTHARRQAGTEAHTHSTHAHRHAHSHVWKAQRVKTTPHCRRVFIIHLTIYSLSL